MLDLQKARPIIEAVQREMETEVANLYRQAQMTRYERIFAAGYAQAERDMKDGRTENK